VALIQTLPPVRKRFLPARTACFPAHPASFIACYICFRNPKRFHPRIKTNNASIRAREIALFDSGTIASSFIAPVTADPSLTTIR